MFKRLAILCYFIAFTALQAHNVIPHHHFSVHQINDHHDQDHEDNDHSPIGDQNHDVEFGKSVVKPEIFKDIIVKPTFVSGHFILLFDKLAAFYTPKAEPPDFQLTLYSIFLAHNIPLRAPPSASFT